MTLAEYLEYVKTRCKSEVYWLEFGTMVYGFLDFSEIKEWELYDLAWALSHDSMGMCTRGDLQGLIELVEAKLKEQEKQ